MTAHMPDHRECALLLLLLVRRREGEEGRVSTRWKIAELSLQRMWGRSRIAPPLVEAVNEWTLRAGWALFFAGDCYALVRTSVTAGWKRAASNTVADEVGRVLNGEFDFSELDYLLAPAQHTDPDLEAIVAEVIGGAPKKRGRPTNASKELTTKRGRDEC